jgi:uncharacterized protein Yka (UPF0111/DUF47 family)
MPQLTGVEGTALGGILIFLGWVLKLAFDSIKKYKRGGSDEDLKSLIQNVSKVVEHNNEISEELMLYLKTRDAGKDADNKHYAEQLNRMEDKIDNVQKTVSEHYTSCKTTCFKFK